MSAVPDQSVAPKDPTSLSNAELKRYADYYLHKNGTLPFDWIRILIERLPTRN
jgi:hypothetical protein